ncbi:MAG: tRNA uridine-5-carboxymethylaminomethyl(34) synthesis GTPase MnmE [Veillonellaceae bacterium]|nr:tRNA uridine-5-carboxymethylaminomethyl(34) synthesis GTPase MnmE [Veillonellaceae bacterium]
MVHEDTISAVATALGEGGIGIIRMSGSRAIGIADNIFRGINGRRASQIKAFQAAYGNVADPETEEIIDEVLIFVMKAPRSYTREDVVEIHCHGGATPIRKILDLTLRQGARLAEPGEFTKRAFLNGRLDLTQAEAVIDIIRSKTDSSLKMAVGQLSGVLSAKISEIRHDILQMVAHLEAAIDFPEDDIEEMAIEDVIRRVRDTIAKVDYLLATAQTGKVLREGMATVIIGKPNVGKSSLLNALLKEKRAIVTDIPGTTRDIIEEYVNIRGIPLKIVDTAGIRETSDVVEKIGVERAREFVGKADLILVLLDASQTLSMEDCQVLDMLKGRQAIVLINKSDLPQVLEMDKVIQHVADKKVIKISVAEGAGLDELEQAIVDMVYSGQVKQGEGAIVNNVRQANLIEQAGKHLGDVLKTAAAGMPPDCIVIDLRAAWEKLGEVTGDTVGEDIITQIFTQFCIGK